MSFDMIISLIGGVGLLLFGLRTLSDNLDNLAGARFRSFLGRVTKNRLFGIGTGALIASLLQSSSAATLLLIGLARAGIVNLNQSIYLILGSDIGTTLTVQLIAFKIFNFALLFIGVGFFIFFLSKKEKIRFMGLSLFGLGLIFLGLKIMITGMGTLKDQGWVQPLLNRVGDFALLGILLGAIFSSLLNSSTAAVGIFLAASTQNMLPLNAAIPLILGANIGTCSTVLISSIGGSIEARRIAMCHFIIKVTGVLLFIPFLHPFQNLVNFSSLDPGRQIANAHTFFNLILAVIFFPFARTFSALVVKLIPARAEVETFPKTRYLDRELQQTPGVALSQATKEALRMAEFVREMFHNTITVFVKDDLELAEAVEKRDDWVDTLDREIKLYLTQLSQKMLSREESIREVALLSMINDLENIGDIIDKNLLELAKKKILKGLQFSAQGLSEIVELHQMVGKNYDQMILAVESQDQKAAQKVLQEKTVINQKERALYQAHIQRLHAGYAESIETSAIHLDVLTNLKRINSHITGIIYPLLELPDNNK
ncbi:MAG: Na/Pi cotransporter family protein [Nitrospirae bacterium]|nr:Na/Pi cotransporter family protein [Nitrospirota bacterium]MBI3352687.1 Na/Pi cotransporter family protein [Nitrospirota bacterium]